MPLLPGPQHIHAFTVNLVSLPSHTRHKHRPHRSSSLIRHLPSHAHTRITLALNSLSTTCLRLRSRAFRACVVFNRAARSEEKVGYSGITVSPLHTLYLKSPIAFCASLRAVPAAATAAACAALAAERDLSAEISSSSLEYGYTTARGAATTALSPPASPRRALGGITGWVGGGWGWGGGGVEGRGGVGTTRWKGGGVGVGGAEALVPPERRTKHFFLGRSFLFSFFGRRFWKYSSCDHLFSLRFVILRPKSGPFFRAFSGSMSGRDGAELRPKKRGERLVLRSAKPRNIVFYTKDPELNTLLLRLHLYCPPSSLHLRHQVAKRPLQQATRALL
jgi:hypothetical protein